MNKAEKSSILILTMAAIVGFLGNYAASYLFAFYKDHDALYYHFLGILSIVLFFGLIFFLQKIARKK